MTKEFEENSNVRTIREILASISPLIQSMVANTESVITTSQDIQRALPKLADAGQNADSKE